MFDVVHGYAGVWVVVGGLPGPDLAVDSERADEVVDISFVAELARDGREESVVLFVGEVAACLGGGGGRGSVGLAKRGPSCAVARPFVASSQVIWSRMSVV